MKVKIIADRTIHSQQMSISKYISKIIDAYRSPTGLIYGIEEDGSTFVLLVGEYEIIEN